MNLYDICIEVLEHASNNDMSIEEDKSREEIATDIYDLFYEYQLYSPYVDTGYINDLEEYWGYRQDIDEDE